MTKITWFAHGTTTDNEQGLATGWNPGELSELGIQQAKGLTKHISDDSFSVVYTSDRKRAINTANLSFGATHELRQDSRLREVDYGDKTGEPSKSFKSDPLKFVDMPFPNGESYKDVEKRVASFLKDVKSEFPDGHIAIIAHLGPRLAVEVLVNDLTWEVAFATKKLGTKPWHTGWVYELQ